QSFSASRLLMADCSSANFSRTASPSPGTRRSLGFEEHPRAMAIPRRPVQPRQQVATPIVRVLSPSTVGGKKKPSGTGPPRSLLPAGPEDRLPHLFTGRIVRSRESSRKEINFLLFPHGNRFA